MTVSFLQMFGGKWPQEGDLGWGPGMAGQVYKCFTPGAQAYEEQARRFLALSQQTFGSSHSPPMFALRVARCVEAGTRGPSARASLFARTERMPHRGAAFVHCAVVPHGDLRTACGGNPFAILRHLRSGYDPRAVVGRGPDLHPLILDEAWASNKMVLDEHSRYAWYRGGLLAAQRICGPTLTPRHYARLAAITAGSIIGRLRKLSGSEARAVLLAVPSILFERTPSTHLVNDLLAGLILFLPPHVRERLALATFEYPHPSPSPESFPYDIAVTGLPARDWPALSEWFHVIPIGTETPQWCDKHHRPDALPFGYFGDEARPGSLGAMVAAIDQDSPHDHALLMGDRWINLALNPTQWLGDLPEDRRHDALADGLAGFDALQYEDLAPMLSDVFEQLPTGERLAWLSRVLQVAAATDDVRVSVFRWLAHEGQAGDPREIMRLIRGDQFTWHHGAHGDFDWRRELASSLEETGQPSDVEMALWFVVILPEQARAEWESRKAEVLMAAFRRRVAAWYELTAALPEGGMAADVRETAMEVAVNCLRSLFGDDTSEAVAAGAAAAIRCAARLRGERGARAQEQNSVGRLLGAIDIARRLPEMLLDASSVPDETQWLELARRTHPSLIQAYSLHPVIRANGILSRRLRMLAGLVFAAWDWRRRPPEGRIVETFKAHSPEILPDVLWCFHRATEEAHMRGDEQAAKAARRALYRFVGSQYGASNPTKRDLLLGTLVAAFEGDERDRERIVRDPLGSWSAPGTPENKTEPVFAGLGITVGKVMTHRARQSRMPPDEPSGT